MCNNTSAGSDTGINPCAACLVRLELCRHLECTLSSVTGMLQFEQEYALMLFPKLGEAGWATPSHVGTV
jgi:hypothetical protein